MTKEEREMWTAALINALREVFLKGRVELSAISTGGIVEGLASREGYQDYFPLVTLRWLGEHLHQLGGEDLMNDILEEAAAFFSADRAKALSITAMFWTGIGNWIA